MALAHALHDEISTACHAMWTQLDLGSSEVARCFQAAQHMARSQQQQQQQQEGPTDGPPAEAPLDEEAPEGHTNLELQDQPVEPDAHGEDPGSGSPTEELQDLRTTAAHPDPDANAAPQSACEPASPSPEERNNQAWRAAATKLHSLIISTLNLTAAAKREVGTARVAGCTAVQAVEECVKALVVAGSDALDRALQQVVPEALAVTEEEVVTACRIVLELEFE